MGQDIKVMAKKIADQFKVTVVYSNSKGEFFTNPNLANLSDDKDKITKYDFSKSEVPATPAPAQPTDANNDAATTAPVTAPAPTTGNDGTGKK